MVGATVGRQPDRGHHRADHAGPDRRGRHRLGERGRPGGGVEGVAPIPLPALRLGDDAGECAGDTQLGGVLESGHCRGVASGMMLPRNLFLRRGGLAGKPWRGHPGDQQADRQHRRGRHRDRPDHRGRRHRQHRRDADRAPGRAPARWPARRRRRPPAPPVRRCAAARRPPVHRGPAAGRSAPARCRPPAARRRAWRAARSSAAPRARSRTRARRRPRPTGRGRAASARPA